MTWFRMDDAFHAHPKVLEAGNAAVGLYVRCCTWVSGHKRDGYVPQAVATMYGTETEIDANCRAGLWQQVEGGYLIPDFNKYNPTRQELERLSEKGRRAAEARWNTLADASGNAPSNAPSNASGNAYAMPSQPNPTHPKSSSSSNGLQSEQTNPQTPVEKDRARQVVNALTTARMTQANPNNPKAYRAKVERNLRTEHTQEIERLCHEYPTAPPDSIAAFIDGEHRALAHHERKQQP